MKSDIDKQFSERLVNIDIYLTNLDSALHNLSNKLDNGLATINWLEGELQDIKYQIGIKNK